MPTSETKATQHGNICHWSTEMHGAGTHASLPAKSLCPADQQDCNHSCIVHIWVEAGFRAGEATDDAFLQLWQSTGPKACRLIEATGLSERRKEA